MEISGFERPLTAPEYGAKTAQLVLEIIQLHPDMHDQQEFMYCTECDGSVSDCVCTGLGGVALERSTCNTTLCIAGWTQFIHEGRVVDSCTRCVVDNVHRGLHTEVIHAAARYLGLSLGDADKLFYASNERAPVALGYVARGEPIDWDEVYAGA